MKNNQYITISVENVDMGLICDFCKNEPSTCKITPRQYDTGQKCYKKLINRKVNWGNESKFIELKRAIGLL